VSTTRVGVDIGGTFTDCMIADEGGPVRTVKVPTTSSPYEGVFGALAEAGLAVSGLDFFAHGTTLGTNALIERTLPRIAVVTTAGMTGVLTQVARGAKQNVWHLHDGTPKPSPVPQRDRLEVTERVLSDGTIRARLNEDEATEAARTIRARGIEAVAICFLHSYANPENELRMAEIMREEHPDAAVTTSHETSPRQMEYERFTTAVLNVGLAPIMNEYLTRLESGMEEQGYARDVLIAQSGGGLMGTAATRAVPVRTANSGPAMGAIAALDVGRGAGYENVIGLDIGGTSSDVSVVEDGRLRTASSWAVEWGHPILFPAVDVVTVGAGGGSVAWFDAGGKLRNGPRSMGVDPGPACYMRGGEEPTNTDAHLVAGALRAEAFLGGAMKVDPELAEKAIRDRIGSALVAFGGAGPLHGARVAAELDVPVAIIPPRPGLTSAMGCLLADIRHDLGVSRFYNDVADADPAELEALFEGFESELGEMLTREGVAEDRRLLERTIDMCYAGQWRVLPIPCAAPVTEAAIRDVVAEYHRLHERQFSFSLVDRPIEIHGVNVSGVGVTEKVELEWEAGTGADAARGSRPVFWRERDGWLETSVYARDLLDPGTRLDGPAVLEQMDSTTLVPPGTVALVDAARNVIIGAGQ
jgi:N-methylhydantoinase A